MKARVPLFTLSLSLALGCATPKQQAGLIQDCPDEKIVNRMPSVQSGDKAATPTGYFIYKGERRELSEFDQKWLKEHCDVKETVVY